MKQPNDVDDAGSEKLVTDAEAAKLESKTKSDDAVEKKDDKKDVAEKTPADEVDKKDGDGGEVAPEPETMDPSQRPLGSQILKSLHSHLKSAYKMAKSSCGPQLEKDGVRDDVAGHCDQLKTMCKSLEGSHARNYPQFKSDLKSDDMDDDSGGEGGDDSDMKSLLAASALHQNSIYGLSHRLKSMTKEKNLTPIQVRMLKSETDYLDGLESESRKTRESKLKSMPKPEPEMTPAERRQFEELQAKLTAKT